MMNAAARLIFTSSKCDHITPLLRQLHWLKVPWQMAYKLAVLVYKCLHGLAPSYLADKLHHPAESKFQRRLHSASSHELSVPRTGLSTYSNRVFQSPLYGSGSVFRSISHLLRHFLSSTLAWRLTSSNSVIRNYCCHARKVTVIYGHVNRSYLLNIHETDEIMMLYTSQHGDSEQAYNNCMLTIPPTVNLSFPFQLHSSGYWTPFSFLSSTGLYHLSQHIPIKCNQLLFKLT